ncbi:alpha/beta hydrolase family protein [Flavobacterium sp. MMS24-S5]|uniref:alpha/beta hydrolase family protein n=1 Tax=Flavobacterium sp. MMS24-S5 TaxID=3416605 RepID=UPI003D068C1E
MHGPGIRGDKLLLLQRELLEKQMGVPDAVVEQSKENFKGAYDLIIQSTVNDDDLKAKVNSYFKSKLGNDDMAKTTTDQITSPWYYTLLKLDPKPFLEKVKCPVLALNGSKDLQVPAQVNLENIKKALTEAGNKKVTIKELPNLNHLFQECKTGSPTEYATIEQTFSPLALEEISSWVLMQTK